MSRSTRPVAAAPPATEHFQSLTIRLNGVTAGDYLAWVRDPEPPALDHWLRSVAISAEPLGELIHIKLLWATRPPTTPSAAAVAAGFPLIPEVVTVRTDPGSGSEPVYRRAPQSRRSGTLHVRDKGWIDPDLAGHAARSGKKPHRTCEARSHREDSS